MTQNKIKLIHRIYSWVMAAALPVLALLFILSCIDIYTSGPRPYSAEAIAQRFHCIIIPVIICILGIIGGIGLNLLLPQKKLHAKGVISAQDAMMRLRKKVSIPPVEKEIRLRRLLRTVTACLFIILMAYPAVYFLFIGQFTVSNLNHDVIQAVKISFVPAIFGLVLCWICKTLVNASYRRETAVYKQALVEGHRSSPETTTDLPRKQRYGILLCLKITFAVIAVIFIVIGILNGGAEDVLKKAIAICTECIGLG